MFQDITKPPPPLPAVEFCQLEDGVTILSPLVRRGTGPPLIILAPNNNDAEMIVEGVPSHMIKWAEEGFTVAEIQQQALERDAVGALKRSIEAIRESSKCEPKSNIGLVCESPGSLSSFTSCANKVPSQHMNQRPGIWLQTQSTTHLTSKPPSSTQTRLIKLQYQNLGSQCFNTLQAKGAIIPSGPPTLQNTTTLASKHTNLQHLSTHPSTTPQKLSHTPAHSHI